MKEIDTVREAAKILRGLVEKVPEGPWHPFHIDGRHLFVPESDRTWIVDSPASFICDIGGDHDGTEDRAAYLATMNPIVGWAMVSLLDAMAKRAEDVVDALPFSHTQQPKILEGAVTGWAETLSAAEAILGGGAS